MLAGLSRCPVPDCPHPPRPWICAVHFPFVSPENRSRLVRFASMYRGGRDAAPPPTMRRLLRRALVDIRTAPEVHWNFADRLAVLVHRLVCGRGA